MAPDFAVETLLGVVGLHLPLNGLGKRGEGQNGLGCLYEPLLQLLHDPATLILGIGRSEDRAHQGSRQALNTFSHLGQHIAHEIGAAFLPDRPVKLGGQ